MSEVYESLLAFIGWCSWMAEPAVWGIFLGAVLLAGAVWIVARARYRHRWSGPQYRRNS
ncbi:MAG TPA: hypothetical protein PK890_02420 [Terrimesophilobacter sp.]|nr:hypothetical protein [Terrimesophilobacter sp.]